MDKQDPTAKKAHLAQHECEIELCWRQNSTGAWIATLRSRKTGMWRQVTSRQDLWNALYEIVGSEAAPSPFDLPAKPV